MNTINSSCAEKDILEQTAITCTFFVSTHFAATKRPPNLVSIPPLPSSITDKLYFKPSGKEKRYSDIDSFYAHLEEDTRHYRNIILHASPNQLKELNEADASHVAKHLNGIGNALWSIWKLAEDEIVNRNISTEYEAAAINMISKTSHYKAFTDEDILSPTSSQASLINIYTLAGFQLEIADRRLAAADALNIKIESLRYQLLQALEATEESAKISKNNCTYCTNMQLNS
ncbi:MAG: hypothetical protein V4525_11785 [Pseudomonadota bacterium]